MKKNLLFLLFIISFRFVGAQNYRPVVPSQAQFFQVPNSNNNYFGWLGLNYWSPIKVASFDSSVVTTDRIKYFSFHTWADTDQSSGPANVCAYENGPAWMGSQIDELNNGMNYLFNFSNDTIRIKSNAIVNDAWNLFDLAHGSYIRAHVDSMILMQQAGISDSVKCFSLSAFDSSGIIIPNHPVNGQTIMLSKSNGFFRALRFAGFPNNNIAALEQRQSVPMPTLAQMYDFNVNDEFEFWGSCYSVLSGSTLPHYSYQRILSKNFSPNLDTVIYHRLVINVVIQHSINPPPNYDTVYTSYQDSVVYPYTNTPFYSTFPEQNNYSPDSLSLGYYELSQDSGLLNNRPIYTTTVGNLWRTLSDSCYLINHFEPLFYTTEYSAGFGKIWYEADERSIGLEDCTDGLVWFHKGSDTWGNYINLVSGIEEESSQSSINIFPSPVITQCEIQFTNRVAGKLFLLDVAGKVILDKVVDGISLHFDMSNIPAGMYFLSFTDNSGVINRKIIKE